MGTSATKAYGSNLYYREVGDSTYLRVAQTKDLASPAPEVGEINITNNDSPNNTKEYLPGMIEPGDMEFEIIYDKDDCEDLYALQDGETIYDWALKYPDGAGWTFKGFVKGFGTEGETEDGVLTNSVSIKVTEKPAFTASLSVSVGS